MLTLPYKIQDQSIAARFQFIDYAGKEIRFLDYSRASRATCMALSAEFDSYIQTREPDGSLRILFDMDEPYYDPTHIGHWKANAAKYENYFHSTAMINAGTLFKVALSGIGIYLKMMGKPLNERQARIFESKEAALYFLSGDK